MASEKVIDRWCGEARYRVGGRTIKVGGCASLIVIESDGAYRAILRLELEKPKKKSVDVNILAVDRCLDILNFDLVDGIGASIEACFEHVQIHLPDSISFKLKIRACAIGYCKTIIDVPVNAVRLAALAPMAAEVSPFGEELNEWAVFESD